MTERDRRIGLGILLAVASLSLAALLVAIFYNPQPEAVQPQPRKLVPYKIAAVGDGACDPEKSTTPTNIACKQKAVSDLVAGKGYKAFFMLGDAQYECASGNDMQQAYAPSYGRVRSITYPVTGNHEYWAGSGTSGPGADICDSNANGYFNYFGAAAHRYDTQIEGAYTVVLNGWLFVVMNSECDYGAGTVGQCSRQTEWLNTVLDQSSAKCEVVVVHNPRFSIGTHPAEGTRYDPWWRAAANKGVDIWLAGHEHHLQIWKPLNASGTAVSQGLKQFVVGTGGKNFARFTTTDARVLVKNNTSFGIIEFTLNAGGYSYRFIPAAGYTFQNSGSGTCH